jgi:hypothetical protein
LGAFDTDGEGILAMVSTLTHQGFQGSTKHQPCVIQTSPAVSLLVNASHVLGAIRAINRLELAGEARRAALNALAIAAPEWFARYGPRFEHARLPESTAKQQA